jgi:hypothetical protein
MCLTIKDIIHNKREAGTVTYHSKGSHVLIMEVLEEKEKNHFQRFGI